MINGLVLLIGVVLITGCFYIASRIQKLKNDRQMWKDTAFVMCEKYNDLLAKKAATEVSLLLSRTVEGININNG